MATILHVSCDFPDALVPAKTPAIKRLVDGASEHRHVVYSLNRVNGLRGEELLHYEPDRFAVAYRALPKGLLLKTRMEAVARFLLTDIKSRRLAIDLVHAHKLTIDGLAGSYLANALGVPIVFSIQGDSDLKVIHARPDLANRFAAHVDAAQALFSFAPWTEAAIAGRFPAALAKMKLLPVAPAHDVLAPAPVLSAPHLVSVFHIASWERKNLTGMAVALNRLAPIYPGIRLDVIGGGTPTQFLRAREAVRRAGAEALVTFLGPRPNDQLPELLKNYAAFILPTRRESYGLAHVEALFAGLPILLSRKMGIDGLLPQAGFAFASDPSSSDSIAEGIKYLLENESEAKAKLASAQRHGDLDHLRKRAIISVYREALAELLSNRVSPKPAAAQKLLSQA
ncbi:MAG: glycosyltransferase family 4 protein [Aestuariivirga sp.]